MSARRLSVLFFAMASACILASPAWARRELADGLDAVYASASKGAPARRSTVSALPR